MSLLHTKQYAVAVISACCALSIHIGLQPFLDQGQTFYILFFTAVIFTNWYGGLRPALVALLIGAVATTYVSAMRHSGSAFSNLSHLIGMSVYLSASLSFLLAQKAYNIRRGIRLGGKYGEIDSRHHLRTKKALRESEERFRATFHQSAFGMAQADHTGRHVLVNDRYCELTGYSREELLQCTFLDITHPDDRPINANHFEQLLARKTHSYELEKRYIHKDGEILWVQVSVSFVLDDAGALSYAIAGVQDISERKRKEETLAFLVELNAATQQLVKPETIMEATTRMLGQHLNADRCAYAEVEADEDHFTIHGDYNRGVNSIVGHFSMASFGAEVLRLMRVGEPYVVCDVDHDPQIQAADLAAYRQTQIQAVVCVPLQKAGRFAACMAVHQRTPRRWTQAETDLIQLVVARCWESIERARALRTLQESERRLQFVLDSMPQKIFTATPTGEIDYVNPQWVSFTGLSFQEIKTIGRVKLIHPDDLEKNLNAWQYSLDTGEPLEFEHRFLRKDGEFRWHVTRANAIRDAEGNITMWVGSNTDIHDVKRAEEAAIERSEQVRRLAATASRLNTTSDVASMMDIVTREARQLIAAHQSAMIFNPESAPGHSTLSISLSEKFSRTHTAEEDIGKFYRSITSADLKESQRLGASAVEIQPGWDSLRATAGEALRINGLLSAPLLARDGTNVGAIHVADRYRDEFTSDDEAVLVQLAQMTSVALENARLMEGLREASRRKDEFLATLAHELRNPLAPMRNMLELIKHQGSDMGLIEQARATMERQLRHMVRLIDDLLDVSRLSRGKLELRLQHITLADVVAQTVEAFESLLASSQQELIITLPEEPVYLYGDAARLIQAFGNLIDNACKYSASGGKIWLSAQREQDDILIKIKDTGIGIPPEKLHDVFEMFAQLDRSLERPIAGLGIGLTLVKRFIEMHGGSVTAHSAGKDLGSEFVIRLRTLASIPAQQVPPAAAHTQVVRARRILVVDDNRDAATSLAMLLQYNGEHTYTAHDGLEALTMAEQVRPDVILLDIGLPLLNGYDVCRRVRAQPWGKDILIIAVSGWGQQQDRAHSQDAGFNHHMVKPVDFTELSKMLASPPEE